MYNFFTTFSRHVLCQSALIRSEYVSMDIQYLFPCALVFPPMNSDFNDCEAMKIICNIQVGNKNQTYLCTIVSL